MRTFVGFVVGIIAMAEMASSDCPWYGISSDRRPNDSALRIVQFNAEWLFVDSCQEDGCPWTTPDEQTKHIDAIAQIIRELKPDIANICEVENCDALEAISDPEIVPYLIQGKDTATGQNVGILGRIDPLRPLYRTEERVAYPIPHSTCGYTGANGTTGVSKHLITEFVIKDIYIALIGAHLLAFPTDTMRCAEREAQAQVLQGVIAEYSKKGFEIIVLGDFNDYDGEVLDANNHKPKSTVLDILKGSAGSHKGEYVLYSSGEKIGQSTRYSDWYDENSNCVSSSTEFSQIDHILMTLTLYDKIRGAFMYQLYEQVCDSYVSDHYPVVVDLVF